MRLTKGGLPPFSRLPGTLVRLPVEIRSKTALILCPLPGVAYKEGTVGTSQRAPAPSRAVRGGHVFYLATNDAKTKHSAHSQINLTPVDQQGVG